MSTTTFTRPPEVRGRVRILGVEIDKLDKETAVERVIGLAKSPGYSMVVTPNVDHIITLRSDELFREIYRRADLVLADGQPIVWASHYLDSPLPERVAGSDIFLPICGRARDEGLSLFLLGAGPGVAAGAARRLEELFPGIDIRGTYSPPPGFEKNHEQNVAAIEAVRYASPDILFVALGAPKQEKWIYAHRHLYGASVSIGVGAAFDFVAGAVKRAPEWMRGVGMEWLFRLLQEPMRLAPRYLGHDLPFFWWIFRERLKVRKGVPITD